MRMVQMYYWHFKKTFSGRCATALALVSALFSLPGCTRGSNTIAVIPRACGTALWEPAHAGAAHVAHRKGLTLYWNAPAREDDVAGQIDLLEKVVHRGYAGIIISPDQTLPLRSPIRRIVSAGLPIVVMGTNLGISPRQSFPTC